MSVLVTGATGFVGGYVVARLLQETGEQVRCVVRGEDPQGRLDAALNPLVPARARGRAQAIGGDLSAGALDVDMRGVTHVLHSAANVQFDQPLAAARAVNVAGARAVGQLAAGAPDLQRIVHVSTAYVGGITDRTFHEADLDVGQTFRNAYEQSKYEAEEAVRALGLPLRVVRPSIVVGESGSGWTSSFNVLYPPMRAFSRGLVTRVPADPEAIIDVVPIDHVADVVMAALGTGPDGVLDVDGDTLHAVAGEDAPRAGALAAAVAEHFDRPAPVLDPDDTGLPPGGLEVYAPYFTVRGRFGADRVRALGLRPPRLEDYLPRLLDFAEQARWGKSIPPRATALDAAA